ncbi:hypothetical protein JVU11DRAFT_8661 [Chiua virens]|nr:hypothetical protein JVU11DRAFT_8661 [Chiua virens]
MRIYKPKSAFPITSEFPVAGFPGHYIPVLGESVGLAGMSRQSLPRLSPNVKKLFVRIPPPQDITGKNIFKYVSHWSNLESLYCPEITLELDAFIHLSRMPALTQLVFTPGDTLPDKITPSNSPIPFANLRDLKLFNSTSLQFMARLLAHVQLPVIRDLVVRTRACPAESVGLFVDAVQSFIHRSLLHLAFGQDRISADISGWESEPILTLDDLRPSMSFGNLRVLDINIKWNVSLTDNELLELASAWPSLEHFHINPDWGWTMPSGITVDGLLHLVETHRSLNHISLAVDTRGYTQVPPARLPSSLGLELPSTFHLNVTNSVIEEESVPAIVALLVDIASLTADFDFCAWSCWGIERLLARAAKCIRATLGGRV